MASRARRGKALEPGESGPYPCPYCKKPPERGLTPRGRHYIVCSNPRCKEMPFAKSDLSFEGAMAEWNHMVLQIIAALLHAMGPNSKG